MVLVVREMVLVRREMVLVSREVVLVVREIVLVAREMVLGNGSGGSGNGFSGAGNESLITDNGTASLYCHPTRRTQQLFSQLLHGRKINISHLLGRPLMRKTGINDGLIDIVKSGKERHIEVYGRPRKTRRLQ